MVSAEDIVKAAVEQKVDYIGLSGLITPSLDEMCRVASELKSAGVDVPLFIGGATTSPLHTAVKIAPLYDGPVFHVKDAAQNPIIAMQLVGKEREKRIACLKYEQEQLRQTIHSTKHSDDGGLQNIEHRKKIDWQSENLYPPTFKGVKTIEKISIKEIRPYINWRHFLNLWGTRPETAEAENIISAAEAMLDGLQERHYLMARVGFFDAYGTDKSIVISHTEGCPCCGGVKRSTTIPTPRQSTINAEGEAMALCDFIAPESFGDHIGAFAVTVGKEWAGELEKLKEAGEVYDSILMQSIGDRLVEAASEWLHAEVRREMWGYAAEESISIKEMFQAKYKGI
jgi:5-methyltetrahydrofolate--homocysteine methyltransferase